MSSVSYSLKNGINRTDNPTVGGVFAYGSYTSAGVFTLFTDYEYGDGTAFVSEPFDATKPLVWKSASQEYPQLGFENLYPNSSITPQPFPTFGIYLHPYVNAGVRQDVGVRVTIPFSGNIAIASIIQRADLTCGDDIGYRIMRNGVAIQVRTFISASATPTTINTPANAFVAGDIIDFIVDAGSQLNWDCDDTALEITLNYQYSKIPTPIITTTPISCSTTVISGTTAYVAEGTIARIYDGTNLLFSTDVVLDPVLYIGNYSFTGLDLTKCGGKNLSVVLQKSGDSDSDGAIFSVINEDCPSDSLSAPIITEFNVCDVRCDYQRVMTGHAPNRGDVVIFKSPYTNGDPIIATTINTTGSWSIGSSSFKDNTKYVAYLFEYYDTDPNIPSGITDLSIISVGCEVNCVLVGTVKGEVKGISNGIIRVFEYPILSGSHPIEVGVIEDGKFEIKTTQILPNVDYTFMATKIN